jgi:hypothetical protein
LPPERHLVSLPHGKSQGKNFFGAEPAGKTTANHGLATVARGKSNACQGNGRESRYFTIIGN